MRKEIILLLALILTGTANAADTCSIETTCEYGNTTVMNETAGEICVYFFYSINCPHCARTEPLINELSLKYPISLKALEISRNNTNYDLFNDFIKRYSIILAGVPAVFISDRAFIGEKTISANLEDSINYFMNHTPVCPETYNKYEAGIHDITLPINIELTIPVILLAAAVDSINPCAFAVLTLLLIYLLELGNRKKVLKVGTAYIITVFIVYFMSGLGLFAIIQSTGITRIMYNTAAVIAIIAGVINVKDFFFFGKGITLAIPESKKPLLKKFMKQATIPAAIILGILVSLFELPCTGGVYLAILSLLSDKMTLLAGLPYLLIYNFIFILPLIAILLVILKGLPPEKINKWRLQNRKYLRLIMGLVMMALGIIMLIGIV